MSSKTARVVFALLVISVTAVLFQNCGETSLGVADSGESSPSLSEPIQSIANQYCPTILPTSLNFKGPGGGIWSHEIVGSKPHMVINYTMANPSLNFNQISGEVKVPEPGECAVRSFDVNSQSEVIFWACTDPLSRFVSMIHSVRDPTQSNRPYVANIVYHGSLAIGAADCVDQVKFHSKMRSANSFWNAYEVVRSDGKRDLYVQAIHNISATSSRIPVDLGGPDSYQSVRFGNLVNFDLSCPSSSPPVARIYWTALPQNKTRLESEFLCYAGSTIVESKRAFLEF